MCRCGSPASRAQALLLVSLVLGTIFPAPTNRSRFWRTETKFRQARHDGLAAINYVEDARGDCDASGNVAARRAPAAAEGR